MVVGTFPGKQYTQLRAEEVWNDPMAWSYAGRNQFWRIMEEIYGKTLTTRKEKQELSTHLLLGFCDLILSCKRKSNNNQDNNLIDIIWNKSEFDTIFEKQDIEKVFCMGIAVAKTFMAWYPERMDSTIALPSPSPLFAAISLKQKVEMYRMIMPTLRQGS